MIIENLRTFIQYHIVKENDSWPIFIINFFYSLFFFLFLIDPGGSIYALKCNHGKDDDVLDAIASAYPHLTLLKALAVHILNLGESMRKPAGTIIIFVTYIKKPTGSDNSGQNLCHCRFVRWLRTYGVIWYKDKHFLCIHNHCDTLYSSSKITFLKKRRKKNFFQITCM